MHRAAKARLRPGKDRGWSKLGTRIATNVSSCQHTHERHQVGKATHEIRQLREAKNAWDTVRETTAMHATRRTGAQRRDCRLGLAPATGGRGAEPSGHQRGAQRRRPAVNHLATAPSGSGSTSETQVDGIVSSIPRKHTHPDHAIYATGSCGPRAASAHTHIRTTGQTNPGTLCSGPHAPTLDRNPLPP